MISLSNVSKKLSERVIFSELDYQINQGEIHAWRGRNGTGKTTLARLLVGLEEADQGEILRSDTSKILIAQQDFVLWPQLSVRKNLDLAAPRAQWQSLVERLFLAPLLKSKAGRLSHGQKQLVCLARTLSLEPNLLIIDEAVSHLDFETRQTVLQLLLEKNNETELALIWIDHHQESAEQLGATIWQLHDGKITPPTL